MKTAIITDGTVHLPTVFYDPLEFKILGTSQDSMQAVALFAHHNTDFDGIYPIREIQKINPNAAQIVVTSPQTAKIDEFNVTHKLEKLFCATGLYEFER